MIGYKLWEKIGHALKARAEAIRKALQEYNRHAAALTPPRPPLSWTDITEMATIGEFDLLRDARQDIREKPWAKQSHREAMNTYFNVLRAREEINRLNIEIPRLFSSMVDEHADFHHAIQAATVSNPPLAQELTLRQCYRNTINENVVASLVKTSRLLGFTGNLVYGRRIGRDVSLIQGVPLPPWAMHVEVDSVDSVRARGDGVDDDDEEGEEEEEIPGIGGVQDAGRFVKFVDRLGSDVDA